LSPEIFNLTPPEGDETDILGDGQGEELEDLRRDMPSFLMDGEEERDRLPMETIRGG